MSHDNNEKKTQIEHDRISFLNHICTYSLLLTASKYAPRVFFNLENCPNILIFTFLFNAIINGINAIYCANNVPKAAPLAPKLKVKMNNGSNIALRAVKPIAYTSGVIVSPNPRKMPLVTSHSVAAGVLKYELERVNLGLEKYDAQNEIYIYMIKIWFIGIM